MLGDILAASHVRGHSCSWAYLGCISAARHVWGGIPAAKHIWGGHSCSLLRKLFLEEQSSHFWKITVAAGPKSWPWTPANVFLTPKCPAKAKELHSWQTLSCYLWGMTVIHSRECQRGSPGELRGASEGIAVSHLGLTALLLFTLSGKHGILCFRRMNATDKELCFCT